MRALPIMAQRGRETAVYEPERGPPRACSSPVDVAARQVATNDLALHVSRPASSAARPTAPPARPPALGNATRPRAGFLVGRRDPLADQLAVDLEGDLARRVRHQRVAARAGEARIVLVLAAPERARGVVEAFRLGREDLHCRCACLEGERDAGRQSAARGADHPHVRRDTERGQVLHDLAPRRALPAIKGSS